ncbi:MAG: helix-turn-helix domain-containing protein [Candidatus Omnitrophica bacterium]|nr:helix-turn-helix domain-containing protein [Candidatus Omnitrophota bacterium]MBU1047035.1 helix-turn-helix domain-containing protein [Candidatus Omnitrophota bacterium]MBU1767601.1 helix-turn-helix domain-containing protein [Candidatus Omnitrophota bacterium]MBU1889295.1 helix-turn-helix domain-containing protein [Candidatus Omnitrophota bacterium]
MMVENKLLSITEMAEYLGIRVSTLYSWVSQKRIPYIKLGRLVRFDLREIDKWLENKTIKEREW